MAMTTPMTVVQDKDQTLPLTLQEAKTHLDILHNDLDDRIATDLGAAVEYLESITGRLFRETATVVDSHSYFLHGYSSYYPWTYPYGSTAYPYGRTHYRGVPLSRQPVQSITKVEYYKPGEDVPTEYDAANYRLVSSTDSGSFLEWVDNITLPSTDLRSDAVQITYVAGYGTALPDKIKKTVAMQLKLMFGGVDPRVVPSYERAIYSQLKELQWSEF